MEVETPAKVECISEPVSGEVELGWLDDALAGRPRAVLWHGPQGLVVPLSYRRHAKLDAACADFAARGWPVRLRRSGGGVVPQGPGVLNVSLAYAVEGPPGTLAERVYADLCSAIARALATFGIDAQTRAVEGSFCDGRFNLAVGPRKIAGTAQYWRRAGGRQAVLAHALLLVDADAAQLSAQASAFEATIGSERRYDPGVLTTVAIEWKAAHDGATPPPDLASQLQHQLAAALSADARVLPS